MLEKSEQLDFQCYETCALCGPSCMIFPVQGMAMNGDEGCEEDEEKHETQKVNDGQSRGVSPWRFWILEHSSLYLRLDIQGDYRLF